MENCCSGKVPLAPHGKPIQYVRPGVGTVLFGKQTQKIFWCQDCMMLWPDMFVVEDVVWLRVFPRKEAGWICWDCFEKRLGERLALRHLKNVRANFLYFKGYMAGQEAGRKQ